jgi:hypothetical protein
MRRILAAVPAPMAVAERQLQLRSTPHTVVKAALAHNATVPDAFNPPSPGTPPPGPPSPDTVNLVDNIRRLHLAVDRALPLHGYILPMADLHRAAGHSH